LIAVNRFFPYIATRFWIYNSAMARGDLEMRKDGEHHSNTRLVTPKMLLPEVVAKYPVTRKVFDKYGLRGCGGPTGPREPVAWFARLHNVHLQQLLDELNEAARESLEGRVEVRKQLGLEW
jgi:hypothetical protein